VVTREATVTKNRVYWCVLDVVGNPVEPWSGKATEVRSSEVELTVGKKERRWRKLTAVFNTEAEAWAEYVRLRDEAVRTAEAELVAKKSAAEDAHRRWAEKFRVFAKRCWKGGGVT
jgi:hypothetical protein